MTMRSTNTMYVTFNIQTKLPYSPPLRLRCFKSPKIINCCYQSSSNSNGVIVNNNNNNNKETTISKDYYLHQISPNFAQKIHTELSLAYGGRHGYISEIDTSRYYLAEVAPAYESLVLTAIKGYCVCEVAFGMACVVVCFVVFCIEYMDTKYIRDHEARNNYLIRESVRANSKDGKMTTP